MISVCIPIYNFDVTQLLNELTKQSNQMDVPCEIILIDDFSSEKFKNINKSIAGNINYIELEQNIGRAKIRNLFLKYAQNENLLFLDCDSIIISDSFLSKYLEAINNDNYNVICGGRVYDKVKPARIKMLSWKYGTKRESQPVEVRKRFPNNSFMTNNFLVSRKILEEIKFDERITGYGHEDTLFGFELKKKGIPVLHINNPVLNGDVEDNVEYLKKTEKGINSLIDILAYTDSNAEFIHDVTVLNTYEKLKSKRLTSIVNIVFILLKPFLKFLFVNGYVNLRLFDFYKLGALIQGFKLRKIRSLQ